MNLGREVCKPGRGPGHIHERGHMLSVPVRGVMPRIRGAPVCPGLLGPWRFSLGVGTSCRGPISPRLIVGSVGGVVVRPLTCGTALHMLVGTRFEVQRMTGSAQPAWCDRPGPAQPAGSDRPAPANTPGRSARTNGQRNTCRGTQVSAKDEWVAHTYTHSRLTTLVCKVITDKMHHVWCWIVVDRLGYNRATVRGGAGCRDGA
jgi:hypothetical protein